MSLTKREEQNLEKLVELINKLSRDNGFQISDIVISKNENAKEKECWYEKVKYMYKGKPKFKVKKVCKK